MTNEPLKRLKRDTTLAIALKNFTIEPRKREENIALYLCLSIISQQLSTRVARVICDRFLELFISEEPTCARILQVEKTQLRSIGLSESKCNYIHNVCNFFMEQQLNDEKLHAMSNEQVAETLIQIKGVGNWTIQMLLMFAMAREDVFAPDDLGIQKAMTKLYKLDNLSSKDLKRKIAVISENWKPFRTYACLALWAWKDAKI
jgi:DNA-3-methyladenine glycosylase II